MTSSTTITIEVSPPPVLDRNGVIVSYRVSYRKEGAGIDDVMTMDFLFTGEDPQRLTLTGLDPGSAYMYSVQAATAVGAGQESFNRSFTTSGECKSLRTTAATHTVTYACLLASVSCSPIGHDLNLPPLLSPSSSVGGKRHHPVLAAGVPRDRVRRGGVCQDHHRNRPTCQHTRQPHHCPH